ncbi:hypothetical protein U27_05675 [Candidatus Vecturithrix granuli]|uniref:Radical SAM core domain-containing protein n=1 Tax=Vecturithrix granuli TaxID=1499967 RepID=A0A081C295_VECG1|nr:hypothetical protein U27_05675 [Candidatus Vecturithrix granuli]
MRQTTQEQMITANIQEYGVQCQQLTWLSPDQAKQASEQRAALLRALEETVQFGYKHTKLDCRTLSPGCKLCGEGTWSCLFINGKCPCGCFYCPTEQTKIDVPMTNSVPFHKPAEYVSFLEKFQFKGASISGGEPFLTFDKTLSFVSAIKKKFDDALYLWLYTSGRFVNTDNLQKLRDAGLDEIRFNIGATKYQLENAKKAVGIIKHVTVEIPAIPEELEAMKSKLHEMQDSGVNYLNLHQLRLTPYNYQQLSQKNYTFLHGEKVTVLESELAALQLIKYALDNALHLPINYCSFVYKHRFQLAAFRKRNANQVKKPYEDTTESGYIRTLWITGTPEILGRQVEQFEKQGKESGAWQLVPEKNILYLSQSLWDSLSFEQFQVFVNYSEAKILPAISYRRPFVEVPLTRNKQVFIERMRVQENFEITPQVIKLMKTMDNPDISDDQTQTLWEMIQPYEIIQSGLQEYF